MEEISFAERDSEEKEAFDIFMGDGLDATSTEIVKLGVATSELIVRKIFSEVEAVRPSRVMRVRRSRERLTDGSCLRSPSLGHVATVVL